jgi:Retrotransposon gag protein
MPESIKITKPDKFDGKDTSIATVTSWTFSVEEYMELAEIPADKQTRLAATWLSDNAKVWYINSYKDIKPLPSLEVFFKAFKEQHLTAHSKADVIRRAETIRQGTQRGADEYSTEFKMLILQLGHKTNEPDAWVTRHYLRGLERTVREGLIPHLAEEDTLDTLIKKAANIARNVEFGKSLDQSFRSSAPRSSSAPPTRSFTSGSTSTSSKSTTGKKYNSNSPTRIASI